MIQETLQRVFGYADFRPGQRQVVEAVTQGRSAAAIFPTGSGKSLCYQLPALHLPHLTLVVSPLLALMQDQLDFLARHGIAAASLDSRQSREEASAVMDGVRRGDIRILMISVERLKNERFRAFLQRVPVSLLVVDEAHCLSEWGHNFRPDYLKLPAYQREFAIPQALLLTATATPRVIEDMRDSFAIDAQDVAATGFYRPNLDLQVQPTAIERRPRALAEWLGPRLAASPPQPSIVYVTLQKTAEQMAAYLGKAGLEARAYHAGLDSETRDTLQQAFMSGEINCIVATIAFGMGIDKADIRNVVHFDLPKSIENYSQEIGRAGRDGQPSSCLMLGGRDALGALENFVYGDTPERDGIERVLRDIRDTAPHGQWEVRLNALSQHSNIRPLPLKTLLVRLELEGIIAPRYAYFAEYRFKYLIEPEALIERFNGERRDFVAALIEASPKAKTWCALDHDALDALGTERGLDTSRRRVISALEYFNDQGFIQLESKQMTEVYGVLQAEFDTAALATHLTAYFQRKEAAEIERLQAMLSLFESTTCLSRRLADYFGDHQAPERCGHCSVCRGHIAQWPSETTRAPLDPRQVAALCAPLRERLTPLADAPPPSDALFTRFLAGLTNPLLTQLKARQLEGFAALEDRPYPEIHAAVKATSSPEA
ncbi:MULTISPECIES: RecQ family ATP-dependent DNA helicase [Chromohalobacter]|uniref:RecQ family ATP-dependent DNA helicase n=1 Tax=Chromohalobacter TaxID=42054 RepID=UPI001FFC584F|nr:MULTISPECIES: RecQ family ATP-dependent DNA helicase [Chromohalobacter]MCK2044794.1 RecQ family ATP-dependent DNA helicase [Chromohalobacter moromii]MCT8467781.1 RecQ family ATP-dependent DNA helicase [Chromohalobacter canadensis]MCT8470471.1 RecQ family ATP-dependent DNA helicase [Chromohalobacter canadensis]MCT8498278.1 RecQ family ATP-dependent DNA helicase [Chromohalobacter canadensis]